MNCKNCGCALDNGAEICYACGTPVDAPQRKNETYTLEDPAVLPNADEAPAAPQTALPVDNARKAGTFVRVVSFLFALIGLILYGVQRKNGENAKALSVANAIMAGLCAKMAVLICYFVFAYMIHR